MRKSLNMIISHQYKLVSLFHLLFVVAITMLLFMQLFAYVYDSRKIVDTSIVRGRLWKERDMPAEVTGEAEYREMAADTVTVGAGNASKLKKRLPNCIIFGLSKCGTRAVLDFLFAHPGVAGDLRYHVDEMNFFNINYKKGLEWYRQQMYPSTPDQVTVEKSPTYWRDGEIVAPRIYKMNESIKLMLVVCDPFYQFVSQQLQNMENDRKAGKKNPYNTVEEAFLNDAGQLDYGRGLVKRGCYGDALKPWLKYFFLDQIHFINGDILRKDPLPEMKKVEVFLGLKPYFTEKSFYFNATKGFHCLVVDGNTRCLGRKKGRPHPTISYSVESTARKFFTACNQPFFKLTRQLFGNWSQVG